MERSSGSTCCADTGIEIATLGPAALVALDDLLDAAAAAWRANRVATGEAQPLPDPAENVDGPAIAISY